MESIRDEFCSDPATETDSTDEQACRERRRIPTEHIECRPVSAFQDLGGIGAASFSRLCKGEIESQREITPFREGARER